MSGAGQNNETTTKVKLPKWYEAAAKDLLGAGKSAAEGGYIPYMGADVAAMAPQTQAGMQGIDAMSAAFGMPTSGGASYLPEAQEFAGGVKGYSSFPGFEEAMNNLKTKYPAAYEFLSQFNKINQQPTGTAQATGFPAPGAKSGWPRPPGGLMGGNRVSLWQTPGSKGPGIADYIANGG